MGYITNLSSNRTPTVQACNEAYGFDAGSISGGITLGPHDSNRFMINVYYTTPSDGKFKPNGSCYKDNDGYRLHLHTQWHSDGTASYEHIYLRPDGYTIEANWVE